MIFYPCPSSAYKLSKATEHQCKCLDIFLNGEDMQNLIDMRT